MSRSSFILAVTLFVVAGSLVFVTSFDRENGSPEANSADGRKGRGNLARTSGRKESSQTRTKSSRESGTVLTLPAVVTSHLDSREMAQVNRILSRTRQDARKKLDQYSKNYGLTKEQQRDIFPLIVAHHDDAHPAMMVNGQPLASVSPGSSLEDSVASFLDSSQQDALLEDASDHDAWWEDVVGQLESDLDTAINNGEMVPADDDHTGLEPAAGAAVGNGEASGHSGGNLFDLLGR
jgi:hypothetical protein